MQFLSKRFYQTFIPKYLFTARLGTTNKLYSYGVDEDELWIFDTQNRSWDYPENVVYDYKPNRYGKYLNHSMQIAVMPRHVYFFGGSEDPNFNFFSD